MRTRRRGGNTWWKKITGSLKKTTPLPANTFSQRHIQLETKVAALDATVEHFKQLLRKKLLEYNRKIDTLPELVKSEIVLLKQNKHEFDALRSEVMTHKQNLDELGNAILKLQGSR